MQQIDLFSNNVPKKPYCTNSLSSGLVIRNSENALKQRYIQANHPNSKLWLIFDIDRPTAPSQFHDEFNIAEPNLFVQNPVNCHIHAAYSLDIPIHLNANSSQKPIRYAAAIESAYQQAMRADRAYAGLITKNPLHDHWTTYELRSKSYDLNELAEHVDLAKFNDRRKKVDQDYGLGRNCSLFEDLRRFAYKNVNEFKNVGLFDNWFNFILKKAESYNIQFPSQLPISEVHSTAKSVASWTWNNYSGSGRINRGRDELQGGLLELQDKQVLSATITNRQRVDASEQAITNAVMRMRAADEKISIRAVAKKAKLNKNTVDKYKHLLV